MVLATVTVAVSICSQIFRCCGESREENSGFYVTRPPPFLLAGVQRGTDPLPNGRQTALDLVAGQTPSDPETQCW